MERHEYSQTTLPEEHFYQMPSDTQQALANVLVVALREALSSTDSSKQWQVEPGDYYLATVHRAENTTDAGEVAELLKAFAALDRPTILPLHPRTRNLLQGAGWRAPRQGRLRVVTPLAYLDMLVLERSARAILTDSGGVQKEAYFWGVPCLTLRRETEWTETLKAGWNRLVEPRLGAIRVALGRLNGAPAGRRPEVYGRGEAGRALVQQLVHDVRRR